MSEDISLDPRKLAAVVYDVGVAVDDLLVVFAQNLAADGVRVGGIVQHPASTPGYGPRAPLKLRDLATGETFSVCEHPDADAEECRMGPLTARSAASRVRAATESSDLVFVSRFGKEEARGEGLRDALACAVLSGRPVLTAVGRGLVDNWLSFTGHIGTLLDARLWVLEDWWADASARIRRVGSPSPASEKRDPSSLAAAPPDAVCRSGPSGGAMVVGDDVRLVPAVQEFELPPVPFPSRRIYHAAGEACLRLLVRKHHDGLRKSAVGSLFPEREDLFDALVEKVGDYVVEACGGPARFTPAHGNTCMRTRHFPFAIDEKSRETWLLCLWRAFEQADFPRGVRREFWEWMEPFSARMINRRTTKAQPRRLSFEVMVAQGDSV